MNFFELCEAPPIKKPSRLLIFFRSPMFCGFTDPPYKIFGNLPLNFFFINFTVSSSSLVFGILPVPIDHTGS